MRLRKGQHSDTSTTSCTGTHSWTYLHPSDWSVSPSYAQMQPLASVLGTIESGQRVGVAVSSCVPGFGQIGAKSGWRVRLFHEKGSGMERMSNNVTTGATLPVAPLRKCHGYTTSLSTDRASICGMYGYQWKGPGAGICRMPRAYCEQRETYRSRTVLGSKLNSSA